MKSIIDSDPFDIIASTGGFSKPRDVTPEIKQMAQNMQPDVEKLMGINFKKFEPTRYRFQEVSCFRILKKII